MKRFVLIFFILFSLLFAKKEIVLKQKIQENNNTIIQKQALILKNWLINNLNNLTPDFLNISPTDSLIKFKIGYDSQTNKITSSLNARLILPSYEKSATKIKLNTGNTKSYKIRITPIIRMYKSILTPVLKNSFTYKNDYLIKETVFNETFYYYFIHNEYKEITSLAFKKFLTLNNLMFKMSKTYYSTQKSNLFYLFGLYFYTQQKKYITTYGFETSGERKKLPFIYSYKIFTTYRHLIFNNKFAYIDITPYLQASKEWEYKIKPYIAISFNIRI